MRRGERSLHLEANGNWNSKTAWNSISQTYPKVDYAGIVWNKLNIPNHSLIPWMALNSGLLRADRVSRFDPNTVTLCGLCMLEDESAVPNISVFSAAMQGVFGPSSVLNVDMISPQPTFMMFADGLIKIKTKNSAFTGLILKLCFTAVIYYVWRERNSRRHEAKQ